MNAPLYALSRHAGRVIKTLCIRERVLFRERADSQGPLLLAVSHVSHLEPIIVSGVLARPVHWMARVEFYRSGWAAFLLNQLGAFPVDRLGCAVRPIRHAIRLLHGGGTVGLFPEGGVATSKASVLRGGPIKQGVCTVSIRTRVPILPVVVVGADRLNRPGAWLPTRGARLWIAFGRPVAPCAPPIGNRQDRAELADRLTREFVRTYEELLQLTGLADGIVP